MLLAWHLSVWGTDEDPTYSKPSLAHMDALAAKSAAFYESLHAHFDLVFNDVTDRDAGYYQDVEGNPHTWWGPADFARETATSPASPGAPTPRSCCGSCRSATATRTTRGTTTRTTACSGGSAPDSAAHLRATRNAGVIGLLFGAGASGNTTQMTDGGLFYRLARRYEQHPCRSRGSSSAGRPHVACWIWRP